MENIYNLKRKLEVDLRNNMLASNAVIVNAIRNLLTKVTEDEKSGKPSDLTDPLTVKKFLEKAIKQIDNAIMLYQQGNSLERVEKETIERNILKSYLNNVTRLLPADVTDEALLKAIQEKATPTSNMGSLMKAMKEVFPVMDGKRLSDTIKQYLASR